MPLLPQLPGVQALVLHPTENLQSYREAEGRLMSLRAENMGEQSPEEDALLEEMDSLWRALTPEEKQAADVFTKGDQEKDMETAILIIAEVKRALAAGTKHYSKDGKLLETELEILTCLLEEGGVTYEMKGDQELGEADSSA